MKESYTSRQPTAKSYVKLNNFTVYLLYKTAANFRLAYVYCTSPTIFHYYILCYKWIINEPENCSEKTKPLSTAVILCETVTASISGEWRVVWLTADETATNRVQVQLLVADQCIIDQWRSASVLYDLVPCFDYVLVTTGYFAGSG